MENRKTKDLCVIVDRYVKDGVLKNKYQKIGVEITEEKDGKEVSFILLNRYANLSGFPDYSGKEKNTSLFVSKFDPIDNNQDALNAEDEIEGEVF